MAQLGSVRLGVRPLRFSNLLWLAHSPALRSSLALDVCELLGEDRERVLLP